MPVDKQKRRTGRRDNASGHGQTPYPSSSAASADYALGQGSSTGMASEATSDEFRFDDVHSREVELKRNRGEISCAECRRLKIKCDKQVPCQSCQRRGCATLCPNGSLATGQGTRFVLAATEHLHKKISRYGARIRELEDALAALQSKQSKEPHPLLQVGEAADGQDGDDILTGEGSNPNRRGGGAEGDNLDREREKERDRTVIADAFGTLSIAEHGVSRFYGPTGGIESLLIGAASVHMQAQSHDTLVHGSGSSGEHAGSVSPPTSTTSHQSTSSYPHPHTHSSTTSAPLLSATSSNPAPLFSRFFPFTPLGTTPEILATIRTHFPPPFRARQLLEVYFEQAYWLFRGVPKAQVYEELVPVVYGREARSWGKTPESQLPAPNKGKRRAMEEREEDEEGEENTERDTELGPHDVALLFLLFAIGAVLEPTPGSRVGNATEGAGAASVKLVPPHQQRLCGQSVYGPYPYHHGMHTASSPSTPSSSCTQGSASSSPTSKSQARSQTQYHSTQSDPRSQFQTRSHPQPQTSSHPQFEPRPSSQSPDPQSLRATLHEAQLLGDHYHQLGQAAMCLQPVLEQPGVSTIQGLHLMSMFNAFAESERSDASSMEASWSLITMAANLSQTIGLHRDSARWGLTPKLVERRRLIFWDLFVADVWSSLHTGRPPTFSLDFVDCHYPTYAVSDDTAYDHDEAMADIDDANSEGPSTRGGKAPSPKASVSNDGEDRPRNQSLSPSTLSDMSTSSNLPAGSSTRLLSGGALAQQGPKQFELWGFRFAGEILAEVAAKTLTADPPRYETIMALDRKVREFPLWFAEGGDGAHAAGTGNPNGKENDIAGTMENTVGTHVKEVALLWIHRSFFAQAIMDNPVNPLKSTYAPSFLAAYRGSGIILTSVKQQFDMFPVMVTRFWSMLTFAFSAAIVFGTVVTRGPKSPLAAQAMVELEQACVLFAKASVYSMRARKALTILKRLHTKARIALADAAQHKGSAVGDSGSQWRGPGIDEVAQAPNSDDKDLDLDDELAIFAGRTRFVDRTADSGSGANGQAAHGLGHQSPESQENGQQPGRGEYGGSISLHAPPSQVSSDDQEPLAEQQTEPRRIQLVQMKQEQDVVELMPPYVDRAPAQTHTSHQMQQPTRQPHHSYTSNSIASGSVPHTAEWAYDHQVNNSSDSPPHPIEYTSANHPAPSTLYPLSADRSGGLEEGMRARQEGWHDPHSHSGYMYEEGSQQQYYESGDYPPQTAAHHYAPTQSAHHAYHSGRSPYATHPMSDYTLGYPPRVDPRLQHPHMHVPSHPGHSTHHNPSSASPQHSYPGHQSYYAGVHPQSDMLSLADLGIAARDSALDQRWSSFMQDSGILDDGHAHGGMRHR